jgi:predicted dinucleotide-binding enzyme
MKIGILGSGLMGANIGTVFAQLGHEVIFSYSRSHEKLQRLADMAGNDASAGSPREVATRADVIVLAVHWSQLDDVLAQAGDLSGKVILSCTVPLDLSNTNLVVGHSDSGAEAIARKLPGCKVVAAFQATPSEVLQDVFQGRNRSPRPSMVYCGDDRISKQRVSKLLQEFGFEPIDAGPLRLARYIEPFAMLATALAYGTDQGPQWIYQFGRLK